MCKGGAIRKEKKEEQVKWDKKTLKQTQTINITVSVHCLLFLGE